MRAAPGIPRDQGAVARPAQLHDHCEFATGIRLGDARFSNYGVAGSFNLPGLRSRYDAGESQPHAPRFLPLQGVACSQAATGEQCCVCGGPQGEGQTGGMPSPEASAVMGT